MVLAVGWLVEIKRQGERFSRRFWQELFFFSFPAYVCVLVMISYVLSMLSMQNGVLESFCHW